MLYQRTWASSLRFDNSTGLVKNTSLRTTLEISPSTNNWLSTPLSSITVSGSIRIDIQLRKRVHPDQYALFVRVCVYAFARLQAAILPALSQLVLHFVWSPQERLISVLHFAYNQKSSLKLILNYHNKHEPFSGPMEEFWNRHITQDTSLCGK